MVFLGTPFHGSNAAKWADSVRKVVKVFYDTNEANVRDLQRESETLRILGDAFPSVLRKRELSENVEERVGTAFFYEELKTYGVMAS
jgi:hypothetical protein